MSIFCVKTGYTLRAEESLAGHTRGRNHRNRFSSLHNRCDTNSSANQRFREPKLSRVPIHGCYLGSHLYIRSRLGVGNSRSRKARASSCRKQANTQSSRLTASGNRTSRAASSAASQIKLIASLSCWMPRRPRWAKASVSRPHFPGCMISPTRSPGLATWKKSGMPAYVIEEGNTEGPFDERTAYLSKDLARARCSV